MRWTTGLCVLGLLGCGPGEQRLPVTGTGSPEPTDSGSTSTTSVVLPDVVTVTVTLDGQPVEGATVVQGGGVEVVLTDAAGLAALDLDPDIPGDVYAIAGHREARAAGSEVDGDTVQIALERFDASDNEAYTFQHPGTPEDRGDTTKCGHCHTTLNDDWSASIHRSAASNPRVQDVYAGTSDAYGAEGACTAAGGQWWQGLEPGTGAAAFRCYLGPGTLPDLNPGCGLTEPCDGVATETGACADCHAPGIDGQLGGRDLLEATGHAYEFGVHCDVCHKVESVDMGAPAGVAGRLAVLRPSEALPVVEWRSLIFGPWGDVTNPKMESSRRDHFQDTTLCGGCHQLDQEVLVPGQQADLARWPSGTLPVHSTWEEWATGPMNPAAPCQACHMPPAPDVGNGADLYNVVSASFGEGVGTGWPRPAGSVRRHVWVGPRSPQVQDMLALAASVDLSPSWDGADWVIEAEVRNMGAGHAIPTGEPSRQLLLVVEATCQGAPLEPVGGDVLPDWAGALDRKEAGEDWTAWPGAQVGDRIRVVARDGTWVDYEGFGRFGPGGFAPQDKGLPSEAWAGESRVEAVAGDTVTLDQPLPAGEVAYRLPPAVLPTDGAPISALAGAPGVGFARVLVDADGNRMVPHHAAVDVVADNRLLPGQAWTSVHRFDGAGCASPEARAVLVHRAFPWAQAAERGWDVTESVMVEVP